MIASMTGFARRESTGSWGTLVCELRSVNHRFLEAGFRLPDELRAAEGELRTLYRVDGSAPPPEETLERNGHHVSPITGNVDQLTVALADPVELKLLHMITGDPQRTPTFIMFGNPDWYFQTSGPDAQESSAFAWNHGGIQKELVGPGIRNAGIDEETWSDHTDIRPTMLALAGLVDDYEHEGRVLAEEINPWALPDGIRASGGEFVELAQAFKRINAPNGELGRASLRISTKALASGSTADDSKYTKLENALANLTSLRDALASTMLSRLEDAAFRGKRISEFDERALTFQAEALLFLVHSIEAGS
jgi:hypothetical protein